MVLGLFVTPEVLCADTDVLSARSLARSSPSAGASIPLYILQLLARRAVGKGSPHQEVHHALPHQEPHSANLSLSNLCESCVLRQARDFGTRQQPCPRGDPLEERTEESKI